MTDVNYDTLQALVTDVESTKNIIQKLVTLVKDQQERIKALEGNMVSGTITDYRKDAEARFQKSRKSNTDVWVEPIRVALALYYFNVKKLPMRRIFGSRLVSQTQMYKIAAWDLQHQKDYCTVYNVDKVLENGVDDATLATLIDDPTELEYKCGGRQSYSKYKEV